MGKVVVIAAQKGGVGKSTTAWTMAAGLTLKGYKVLAIDFDPQGNLSFNANINHLDVPTLYDVMQNQIDISKVIIPTPQADVIPANRQLSTLDFNMTGREHKLKKCIAPIRNNYDFIVIDTPPELGDFTINAFTAADRLILVATASAFSANGIKDIQIPLEAVQEYCNQDLKTAGVLLVKFNPRTNVSQTMKSVTATCAEQLGTFLYQTCIRNATAIEETQALRTDIFTYSPNAPVANDYQNFIDEFLSREGTING